MDQPDATAAALADLQWLRCFAARLAADADDVDDLVQDTLIAAWSSPTPQPGRSLRPWLATVLRNRFRMARRGAARRDARERLGADDAGSHEQPDQDLLRLEVLRVLFDALQGLPSDDQRIIVLRYFDGECAADIARKLELPAATVRSRLHRSLARLRDALDRRFGERRAWGGAVALTPWAVAEAGLEPVNGAGMGTAAKLLLVVGVTATAGALASAAGREVPRSAVATDRAARAWPAPPTAAKAQWEQRRARIRAAVSDDTNAARGSPMPAPAAAPDDLARRSAFRREVVRDCLDDLDSTASGALTVEVVEIGAPDVGSIYASIDVLETTLEDREALQCIIESMYGYLGDAPAQAYERASTWTFSVGEAKDADEAAARALDFVVGAHINEVRFCEKQAAQPRLAGEVTVAFTIAVGGTVAAARPGATALPEGVVDCIVERNRRWRFPELLAGRTVEYRFVLPIGER